MRTKGKPERKLKGVMGSGCSPCEVRMRDRRFVLTSRSGSAFAWQGEERVEAMQHGPVEGKIKVQIDRYS